ncbi:polyprotein [Plakobranchus ocellatus]|uniref:Polyprotein n=1 Tax=Plakobranchus ocellatus TaxID=259542 RepID=A0AAV4DBW0_9GAST|nr:polyprotein [Plakobranchus ocellatus]
MIKVPLTHSSKNLKTYTGEKVDISGEAMVEVCDGARTLTLPIVVVKKGGPPLLGRNWLDPLNIALDLNTVDQGQPQLEQLLANFENVFSSSAGCLRDVKVKLYTAPGATPKFCTARQPPYALREAIEEELNRLQRDGIIEAVEHSEWATPIVLVRKKDGTVRICGDYKTTLNKVCKGDNHPIPRIEDLAHALSGGDKFTKLDLSHAYTQLELDESSREMTTINTHKGLFKYHRLCFGISAAPGIFQRTMEGVFQHVSGCVNYLDDVYVTGRDDQEHMENLKKVLSICQNKGISLRRDKCDFMQKNVTFLGYRLDKHGIHPLADKIQAIRDAPTPRNHQELRSFLGLINYYGKFIPNVTELLAPLYVLLRQGQRWCWGKNQESAFSRAKNVLSSDKVLMHFNPKREIVLVCDASPIGVGAILSQVDDNGDEKPVIYASRALSDAERKYSQIDREGLALIFAVKKFHKYIYGRDFKLVTDHKPLLGLFGENKAIPEHASARVQRWAIILSAHSYSLLHRPGRNNNADALSRLPLPYSPDVLDAAYGIDCVPESVHVLFTMLDKSLLSSRDIALETHKDETLKQVCEWVLTGWPCKTEEKFRAFAARKNELSVENNCLLWGTRVVIPQSLEGKVLELLHGETHIGMAQMKALARSWLWWPQIDAEIEKSVRCCYTCQKFKSKPAKAPLSPGNGQKSLGKECI